MEFDFVYADLQTTVIVKADNESVMGQLDDVQIAFLGNLFYLTLNTFTTATMAKYFSEVDKDKIKVKITDKENDDG